MAPTSILLCTFSLFVYFPIIAFAFAFDAAPLYDFCVADPTGKAKCKDPSTVTANDFFVSNFHLPGNTSNPYGVSVATASIPGLNGLGMTFMRVDLAPDGFFPPHFHTRATELVAVLEGSMEIGFITSYPEYRHFKKVLNRGDVFVVPVGLVHHVRNVGRGSAAAHVAFNSQNPGVTNVPNALFAAEPAVDSVYLSKAFRLSLKTVENLQRKF